ncbi:EAL domain-containing protein [Ampullimonas aquatilis]|uniref:sensor domain-containing protein n=1 Tax=Ampullimonas aquatilis TaxID=1341549 RepID=UPI003C717FAB
MSNQPIRPSIPSSAQPLGAQDLDRILRATSDFVWLMDANYRLTHCSGSHVPPDFRPGLCWWNVAALETRNQNWQPFKKRLMERKPLNEVVLFYTYPDGQSAWLEVSGAPQFSPTGEFSGYAGMVRFVTERIEDEERLQEMVRKDGLTDLPNRQALMESLCVRMQTHIAIDELKNQPALPFAAMFVDLDSFHRVNNSLGHQFGDKILISLAERLCVATGTLGEVFRYGGDEFVVLTHPGLSLIQQDILAHDIINSLAEPLIIDRTKLTVTVSIGIATYPEHGQQPELLIKAADTAMYHAKRNGKNGYLRFEESMNAAAGRRLLIESQLREALISNGFYLLYQPQYDVLSKQLCGFEALLRMGKAGEKGGMSPVEFIPVAEDTRLIVPIGYWIVDAVCLTIKDWLAAGHRPIKFAINLSAIQLEADDIVENIVQRIKRAGIPMSLIEIEITESCMIEDIERALVLCNQFASAGLSLAIDDFGTGFSSLSVLSRMPAKKIKIDRSFVVNSTKTEDDAQIARAIIMLGKNLNRTVLAEGVETLEQFEFLKAARCDSIQGFGMGGLFSKETITQAIHPKQLQ